jgi:hypothetical protein
MRAVWRYMFAAIFAGIAVWWYTYSELPSQEIFSPERLGRSITTGITFGVVFGLVVLFAAEIPERLRGFWPWWSRLVLNLILGLLSGSFVWIVFAWFFLYYKPEGADFNPILMGGLFAALAFALSVVIRIPGWIGAIWSAILLYIPLYLAYQNFTPLIYVRPDETIQQYAIPIVILIAIGAYLPMLVSDGRKLWRRARPSRTTTPAAAT